MLTTIDVLGPLMVQPPHKLPKKASALVIFLMMNDQPVPRARLADLLWPYQGSEQARHSLRNCLLELRKRGADLRSDFANCAIGEDVTGDIHRFMPLARSAAGCPSELDDLLAACDLYRGEFLDGFHIASEPWEEWVDSTREELKNAATGALLRVSRLLGSQGRHAEAVDAARRLVHLDPLVERFHRQLMRALAAAGRGSESVQQYKRLETMLRVELAVCPDIHSQQLLRDIAAARSGGPARLELEPAPGKNRGEPERKRLPVTVPVRPRPIFPRADEPVMLDDLTVRLEKLGSAMVDWRPGKPGLTIGMIKQAGDAMLAAAADRRRDAEDRLSDFPYTVHVPASPGERIAA
jgi:DNA-binding SARP family transcriptional activator